MNDQNTHVCEATRLGKCVRNFFQYYQSTSWLWLSFCSTLNTKTEMVLARIKAEIAHIRIHLKGSILLTQTKWNCSNLNNLAFTLFLFVILCSLAISLNSLTKKSFVLRWASVIGSWVSQHIQSANAQQCSLTTWTLWSNANIIAPALCYHSICIS